MLPHAKNTTMWRIQKSLTWTADGWHRKTTDFTSSRAACIAAARPNVALVGARAIDAVSTSEPEELTVTSPPAVTSWNWTPAGAAMYCSGSELILACRKHSLIDWMTNSFIHSFIHSLSSNLLKNNRQWVVMIDIWQKIALQSRLE